MINPLEAPLDDEGMMPDALQRALEKGAKAVLITPRAHNPTGVSITAKRAKQLQDVLRQIEGGGTGVHKGRGTPRPVGAQVAACPRWTARCTAPLRGRIEPHGRDRKQPDLLDPDRP